MLVYGLIGLSLALSGTAIILFMYLAYLDRVEKEHKKYIVHLEAKCRRLSRKLDEAETQIAEQSKLLGEFYECEEEEVWADVIDDR